MTDKAHIKLFEAEHFAEDARGRAEVDDEFSPAVAMGHGCDAIILAIDALCHHAGASPAKRHDDAPRVFLELIRSEQIPADASQWRDFIQLALRRRNAFQYQGALTSRTEARRFAAKVSQFVAHVRSVLSAPRTQP